MIVRNQIHYFQQRALHKSPTAKVIKAFRYDADHAYKPGDRFPFQKLGLSDDQLRGYWTSELIELDVP